MPGQGSGVEARFLLPAQRGATDHRDDPAGAATREQRRQVLLEFAADVVVEVAEGRCAWVSPSVREVLGWLPPDLIGQPLSVLIHPADIATVLADRPNPRLAGDWREARFGQADGSTRWMSVASRAVPARPGTARCHVLCLRDVQAETTARLALADSEAHFRLVAENASDIVVFNGADGLIKWVSPSITALLGWAPGDLVGRDAKDLTHPDDRPGQDDPTRVGRQTGRTRFATAAGGWRWLDSTLRTVTDESGTVLGRVGSALDCESQVETRQALAESEDRYRVLAENVSDLVFRGDLTGVLSWVSASVTTSLGWVAADMVGHRVGDFLHPEDRERIRAASSTGEAASFEARMLTTAGGYLWVAVEARPFTDHTGRPVGRVAAARDIQAEHDARDRLTRSEQRFRLAMESAPGGMAVLDLDRRFLEVNPALCRMLGRDQGWLLAHCLRDVLDGADDVLDLGLHAAAAADGGSSATAEAALRHADGRLVWAERSVGVLRDDDGAPRSYVSQFVDITAAKLARESLHFEATHDPLTLLANRRELLGRAEGLLADAALSGTQMAVLFLDLDGFKPINDAHGHAAGDRVLIDIAARITAEVRAGDLVARVGGDEFVVLMPGIGGVENAQRIAAEISRSAALPIDIGALEVHVTVSIGIALAEPGDDVDDLLQHADHALYRAKRSGRARAVTFDPCLDLDVSP
jgi:diguanylate cyclase (GGDEF)-like protein/PAS domain S-box-containing protein